MNALWLDWRFSVLLCCLFWGMWGVFGRMAALRAGWPSAALIGWAAGVVAVAPLLLPHLRWPGLAGAGWAAAYGVCGAVGSVFFVRALQQGPASLVAPMAEGYLIITVLLAVAFLGEEITIKRVLGLLLMLGGAALLATEGKA